MVTETPAPDPVAPGDLGLLQALVNTLDVEENTEKLGDVASLRSWLREQELIAAGEARQLDDADRTRLLAFREAMRALLRANHGDPLDPGAAELVNRESARAVTRVEIDVNGGARLVAAGGGIDKVIARLLAAVAQGDAEGTWRRLKVCADGTCAWAFYDVSRNASRAWCSMATCGNRNKARRLRGRRGAGAADSG